MRHEKNRGLRRLIEPPAARTRCGLRLATGSSPGGLLTAILACSWLLGSACAVMPVPPEPLGDSPSPPAGALRVRLAFGAEADLDLYVTDPDHETVYYANTPTRLGGTLEADLRCGASAPRVEVVTFEAPTAGRYRIGVDHPALCRKTLTPSPFLLVIEADELRLEQRGELALGEFQPVVIEFTLD